MINSTKNTQRLHLNFNCTTIKECYEHCISAIQQLGNLISSFLELPFRHIGSKFFGLHELTIRIYNFVVKKIFNNPCDSFVEEIFKSTGYSLTSQRLPIEKVNDAIKQARLYAAVHKGRSDWLPFNCKIHHEYNDDLKMVVIQENNKMHVIFGAAGASGPEFESKNLFDASWNLVSGKPNIYAKAENLYLKLKEEGLFEGKEVVFSGQCFGGSIAAYVALKQQEKAVCLNSLPLGSGLQWDIGRDRLSKAHDLVTLISVDDDIISNPPFPISFTDFFINIMGVRTAGNFGNRYTIPHPEEYTGLDAIHRLILGSLIKYRDPSTTTFQRKDTEKVIHYLNAWDATH